MRDFMDTDFEDVPMRVHYEYEKEYDRVTITKVTHNGNDCTSLAVALCGDLVGIYGFLKVRTRNFALNMMQLTEGRGFNHKTTMGARNLNISQNFLRSSKPLLLVRCCYARCFFLNSNFK
jgi:hypothetical protein